MIPSRLCLGAAAVLCLYSNGAALALLQPEASPWQLLKVMSGSEALVRGIVFVDARHGWLWGEDNTILKTVDGGDTWLTVESYFSSTDFKNSEISKLWFLDRERGWAAGRSGRASAIWRTADGGRSWITQRRWQPRQSGYSGAMLDIQFVSERHAWAVGTNGTEAVIVATKDGGNIWNTQYSGGEITSQFNAVRFADAKHGWALSPEGVLYTDNGGDSWRLRYFGTGLFHDLHAVGSSAAWVAGRWGSLLYTKDSVTWADVEVGPEGNERFLGWVKFASPTLGWAIGANCEVFETRDSGKAWRQLALPDSMLAIM